jgi:hypothetical protein
MRASQSVGCSSVGVAVNPTPVSVSPDASRPVMALMPGPAKPRPAGVAATQRIPSADVHITTS